MNIFCKKLCNSDYSDSDKARYFCWNEVQKKQSHFKRFGLVDHLYSSHIDIDLGHLLAFYYFKLEIFKF